MKEQNTSELNELLLCNSLKEWELIEKFFIETRDEEETVSDEEQISSDKEEINENFQSKLVTNEYESSDAAKILENMCYRKENEYIFEEKYSEFTKYKSLLIDSDDENFQKEMVTYKEEPKALKLFKKKIYERSFEQAKKLINKHTANAKASEGNSFFLWALKKSKVSMKILKKFLEEGADPNTNEDGSTALLIILESDRSLTVKGEMLKLLMRYKLLPTQKELDLLEDIPYLKNILNSENEAHQNQNKNYQENEDEVLSLSEAIIGRYAYEDIADLVTENNVNGINKYGTPLFISALNKFAYHPKIIKAFSSKQAFNTDMRDNDGNNPVMIILENKKNISEERLLEAIIPLIKANPGCLNSLNNKHKTAKDLIVEKEYLKISEFIKYLENSSDPVYEKIDAEKLTESEKEQYFKFLKAMVKLSEKDMDEYLTKNIVNKVSYGNKDCKEYSEAKYISHLALTKEKFNIKLVNILIKKGVNLNLQDRSTGDTAFTLLMQSDYPTRKYEVAAVFLANGANPNIENNEYETALSLARKNGHFEVVEMIKDFNSIAPEDSESFQRYVSDIEKITQKISELQTHIRNESVSKMKLVLDKYVANAKSLKGLYLIELAFNRFTSYQKRLDVIKSFVAAGTNLEIIKKNENLMNFINNSKDAEIQSIKKEIYNLDTETKDSKDRADYKEDTSEHRQKTEEGFTSSSTKRKKMDSLMEEPIKKISKSDDAVNKPSELMEVEVLSIKEDNNVKPSAVIENGINTKIIKIGAGLLKRAKRPGPEREEGKAKFSSTEDNGTSDTKHSSFRVDEKEIASYVAAEMINLNPPVLDESIVTSMEIIENQANTNTNNPGVLLNQAFDGSENSNSIFSAPFIGSYMPY